jgi:hypothetical protein
MPANVATAIAAVILMNTVIGMILFMKKRRRDAREDEMTQAASARGWQFAAATEGGYRVHTWKGSSDGIAWVAENWSAINNTRKQRRPDIARWHAAFHPGINQPIVLIGLPPGKDHFAGQLNPSAGGEGLVARLAHKAFDFALDKAIDLYFGKTIGKEVDAAALHRVDTEASGFVVMAADKDEGMRVMQQGFERALADATQDAASILSRADRPSILLRRDGISLGQLGHLNDANDIERFTRTGVALTRAFTFGRR